MSVLSIVSISTVTVSKEILCKSPVMHPTNVNKCLVDSINNHNYAHAEMDKKIIDKKKISIITGNSKNFPFLCKCIRYNYTDYGEYLCLYNKNQILLYSIEEEFCVYYRCRVVYFCNWNIIKIKPTLCIYIKCSIHKHIIEKEC